MQNMRLWLAVSISALLLPLLGTISSAAAAQNNVVSCLSIINNSCPVTFDSDTLIAKQTATGFSFTVSGKDNGSGTFTATPINPGSTTFLLTGSQTINGTTGPLNCTFNSITSSFSGQCGVVGQAFTASGQSAAAATVTSATQGTARSQTLAVTTIVADRVRTISRDIARGFAAGERGGQLGSAYRGLSAGSADARWGVWGDASGALLRNDTAIGYDGSSVVALAGVDYIPERSWVVGLTAGYTHADLTLKSVTGTRQSDGAVVGPYVSYIISPNFSTDAQVQYTGLSNRVSGSASGLSAGFGGDRVTGAVNLNGYADEGPYKLTGFGGYAYTWEGSDKSVLSSIPPFSTNTRYGVLKWGGEAGYTVDTVYQVEAYVPLTFLFETTTPRDGTSRFAIQPGFGIRWLWLPDLKAGILFTSTEVKTHTRDMRLGGNLRWIF
jgi:Autotransporter beta-domain